MQCQTRVREEARAERRAIRAQQNGMGSVKRCASEWRRCGRPWVQLTRIAGAQGDGKKKKPKFDMEYVLRFNALYFSPLTDAMVAYAERDANGAKAAGGAGLPKFIQKTSAPASESALYQASAPCCACCLHCGSVVRCEATGACG